MAADRPTFRELAQDFTFSAGELHGRMPANLDYTFEGDGA